MKKVICIHFYSSILAVLCLLTMGRACLAQSSSVKTYDIPFILTAQNNIAIAGIVNGNDTVTLMFHTSASSLTLTSAAIARMKSLHFEGADTVKSWGGGANRSRYSKSNTLQIGKASWKDIPLWEDLNSGAGTGGKFGPNLFAGQVIDIDFDKMIIKISPDLPSKSSGYTRLDIDFKNDMMFVKAGCNLGTIQLDNQFLIHSGYSGSILFDDAFTANNSLDQKLKVTSETSLKDSFGNVLKVKKAILPTLVLGKDQLSAVPVGFFQGALGRQKISIIGADLLKRFNILISADRKAIYIKRNGLFNMPYTTT